MKTKVSFDDASVGVADVAEKGTSWHKTMLNSAKSDPQP